MIEKLIERIDIETQFGGPALADEVVNELICMTQKVNELIEASNKHEAILKRLKGGRTYGKLERDGI